VACGYANYLFLFVYDAALTSFFKPAMEDALAGSTKIPSTRANIFWASKISSSETASAAPNESRMAATAFFQLTGAPIRIAVAMVSG
jgi:hypothetical protein